MNLLYCAFQVTVKRFVYMAGQEGPNVAAERPGDPMDRLIQANLAEDAEAARGSVQDATDMNRFDLGNQIEAERGFDESGDAYAYINTFQTSPKLDAIYSEIRIGLDSGGPDGLYNFINWPSKPAQAAQLFEKIDGYVFMPGGPGRPAFVEGLYANPDSVQHQDSIKVLRQIVAQLRTRFELENSAKMDLAKQANTPLHGHTIDGYLNNFKNSWNRSSGGQKLMLAGALGAVAWFAISNKDKTLPGAEKITYSDVALWGAAALGINQLWGATSHNGKTPLNEFGVGTDIGVEDLKDPFIKMYAIQEKMDEDKTKLRALTTSMNFDVKELYTLYKDASVITNTKKEIPTRRLGFAEGQINGEALYNIIDSLVRKTAENRIRLEYMAEQGITDRKDIDEGEVQRRLNIKLSHPDEVMVYFEDKYMHGPVGASKQTLIQAIVNEHYDPRKNYEKEAQAYDAKTLPNRLKAGLKSAYDTTAVWVEKDAYPWVYTKGEKFYGIMRDDVVGPVGGYFKAKYNHYIPAASEWIKEKEAFFVEGKVEKLVDPKLKVSVDTFNILPLNQNRGTATVMGIPGFEILEQRDEQDIEWIIIDGVKFDPRKDIKANAKASAELEKKAQAQALRAYGEAAQGKAFLEHKTVKWNAAEGAWKVEGVTFPPYQNGVITFPTQPADVKMYFDTENKPQFKVNGRELKDLDDVARNNFESMIENTIVREGLYSPLKGLKVVVKGVEVDSRHGYKVKVTIGGLEAVMAPRNGANITDHFAFLDEQGNPGDLENLKITEDKGGREFLKAKSEQILTSQEFLEPFFNLEAIIENTSDTVLDRIKDTSVSGPIKHTKWRYLLDLKKAETLELYQHMLRNKTVADMEGPDGAHVQTITIARTQLETLYGQLKNVTGDDRKERFNEYLKKLETVNYDNPDYIELFNEYKAMINNFDLEGSESWENAILDVKDRYEIYQALLWVWSVNTRAYRLRDADPNNTDTRHSLTEVSKTNIRVQVIEAVKAKLQSVAQKGDGTVTFENLPPSASVGQAKAWITADPNLPLERSPWAVED